MSNKKFNLNSLVNSLHANNFNYNLITDEIKVYSENMVNVSALKVETFNSLQALPILIFCELVRIDAKQKEFEIVTNTFEAKVKQGGEWYIEKANDKGELVRDTKINKAISTAKAVYKHLVIEGKALSYKGNSITSQNFADACSVAISSNYEDLQGFADFSFATLYDNIKKDEKAESEAIEQVQAQHGEKFNDLLTLQPETLFNEIQSKKESILKQPASKKPTIKEVVKPIDAMQVKNWLHNTSVGDVQAIFAEAQKILTTSRHKMAVA